MALQKQLVQAPLGLGIDTKTDPKQVASSGLLELENGVIKQTYRDWETDRKSTRLNSSHSAKSRMPSSA